MYKIISKRMLNPTVCEMEIEAPLVARKAEAGQFIILRVDEHGERIPLTVAGFDRQKGIVKIIFQIVGASTKLLEMKNAGECIQDFVGPLGLPSDLCTEPNLEEPRRPRPVTQLFGSYYWFTRYSSSACRQGQARGERDTTEAFRKAGKGLRGHSSIP